MHSHVNWLKVEPHTGHLCLVASLEIKPHMLPLPKRAKPKGHLSYPANGQPDIFVTQTNVKASIYHTLLARAVGVPVGQRSGGRQAITLVATITNIFFVFLPVFSSVIYFSHRRSAPIKKLIKQKMMGASKNLRLNPFPGPVGHFGAPWWPF